MDEPTSPSHRSHHSLREYSITMNILHYNLTTIRYQKDTKGNNAVHEDCHYYRINDGGRVCAILVRLQTIPTSYTSLVSHWSRAL